MKHQKTCSKCNNLVLGQVDKTKKSVRVEFRKSDYEMGVVYFYPSKHELDECYYHVKFGKLSRRK